MNQVKAGAILNYVIIGLNTLLGLLYTPYMLHMLGQNEYGLYSLVASIIAYLTILDFGFGNAIVRYTAKFRAEGKLRVRGVSDRARSVFQRRGVVRKDDVGRGGGAGPHDDYVVDR